VSLILGNLVLVDLRIFGLGTSLAAEDLARLALPLVLLGAGLCALSGLLMFSTQAADLLANRVFSLKMLILMLAAGNAVWFHVRGSLRRLDRTARWLAFTSLVLWLITLGLGRWIAYA
jgi:NO-binding membrane sensor protein with MHYT domain